MQQLLVGEMDATVARGLVQNLGIELVVPVRVVRGRIHYEDLDRQAFTPPFPDYHHRNETLSGLSDPRLYAHFGSISGPWSYGARAGVSVPLGRTEPNPFELGRLGLPHEHIQLGTGTWNPLLIVGVSRSLGALELETTGSARISLYENSHGYQTGNLYSVSVAASRNLGGGWGGSLGMNLAREEAERWSGRLEEEGNLGRRDLWLVAGIGRTVAGLGNLAFNAVAPLHSEVSGEQASSPWILSLMWSP